GTRPQMTEGRHSWVVWNRGPVPSWVRFEAAGPAIFTEVHEFKNGAATVIPPRESLRVPVVWATRRANGPVSRHLSLGTSDPRTPRIELEIKGDVVGTGPRASEAGTR